MTGSGKTGLCLSLIEEAAIDGVPVIAIDPKGDLGNLLLTFPGAVARGFRALDRRGRGAARRAQTPTAFAAPQAERWKKGLAEWGQDGARIERLRDAGRFRHLHAGQPGRVSRSRSSARSPRRRRRSSTTPSCSPSASAAPRRACSAWPASTRRPATAASTSCCPRRSSTAAGRRARTSIWPGSSSRCRTPPFDKVGVVDLESFFPAKDRFELAMRLNNLLASPGFAHGSKANRSIRRAALHGRRASRASPSSRSPTSATPSACSSCRCCSTRWSPGCATQTGTSSLRAMLYMDEIFGYFPPVANPPSKPPLLTLLKQARAFGLGVVLATQNPVDLDYKGLANAGTWFLGRLQTERDKERVLDGLEGAAAGGLDRPKPIACSRRSASACSCCTTCTTRRPVVFQTRWTMSYLRGPLTRDQIRALTPVRGPSGHRRRRFRKPPAASGSGRKASAAADAAPVMPPGHPAVLHSRHRAPGRRSTRPSSSAPRGSGSRMRSSGSTSRATSCMPRRSATGAVPVDWGNAVAARGGRRRPRTRAERARRSCRCRRRRWQPKNYAVWQKAFAQ